MFFEKKILVGVTGGIAAYKAGEIIRELKQNRAEVQVVMTKAAMEFITPLTLATLSDNPVLTDMFGEDYSIATIHIEAARWADAVLICPATANTIGKIASGIADNLLTTLVMATTAPVIICPAMNKEMYANAIYQQNVEKLKQRRYHFVESEAGELACGEFGWGRLADSSHIIHKLKKILLSTNELRGKKVLVTAGRTEEPLDPVRFISNYSSGKMGFTVAEAAALKGAEVTLISGPNHLRPPEDVKYILVQTSDQMAEAVSQQVAGQDIIIMAAAVADFKPEIYYNQKIKKISLASSINLVKTKDILKEIGKKKGRKILVGFAVETENELQNARQKLIEKSLDLVVLNNPLEQGAAFGGDTNIVTFIDASGNTEKFPLMSKREVAVKVIDKVIQLMKER
jgi:phosphopantothenoylcysteine decarboxylase/phosphopantothenate--cysteine ligase